MTVYVVHSKVYHNRDWVGGVFSTLDLAVNAARQLDMYSSVAITEYEVDASIPDVMPDPVLEIDGEQAE